MKYALFLGCTVPVRGRNYEMATRKVAGKLGIEFIDINDFSCCGFPIRGIEYELATLMCARNLALAEAQGVSICVLCSACTAMLAEVNHELRHDSELMDRVNEKLARIGRTYRGNVEVRHFSRILYEDIGVEEIDKHTSVDLSRFLFAPHYGCHYLKPSSIHRNFDSVETPGSLGKLIEVTGAEAADLGNLKHCCGGAVMAVAQDVTYRMAERKLDVVKEAGADAMCLICPFCAVVYDDNQKSIERERDKTYGIPVLYYPQILGLAMGFDPKELGLKLNKVKTKELLKRLESEAAGA